MHILIDCDGIPSTITIDQNNPSYEYEIFHHRAFLTQFSNLKVTYDILIMLYYICFRNKITIYSLPFRAMSLRSIHAQMIDV